MVVMREFSQPLRRTHGRGTPSTWPELNSLWEGAHEPMSADLANTGASSVWVLRPDQVLASKCRTRLVALGAHTGASSVWGPWPNQACCLKENKAVPMCGCRNPEAPDEVSQCSFSSAVHEWWCVGNLVGPLPHCMGQLSSTGEGKGPV